MQIKSNFDGGNIIVESLDDPSNIRLQIRKDHQSDFYQWFYFELTGASGQKVTLRITNAGGASYTEGWSGYRPVVTDDGENWVRIDADYADGELVFSHKVTRDAVRFAYFVPFSMERHQALVKKVSQHPNVQHEILGQTLDGQDMDLLIIGDGASKKFNIWFIARQHPGETMAEWWMEGLFDRLLDADDEIARTLLDQCRIYVIPNMNPDGSTRGHLRTNAAGMNLNRAWAAPSMDQSPEVFLVRRKMHETGVDFHMDVHGDEALPYNFLAGFESIPSLDQTQLEKYKLFQETLDRVAAEFQTVHGYPVNPPESSDLRKCTDYTAESFGCAAMTLEMPFKDNADNPDIIVGWSPEKCRQLAKDCLEALSLTLTGL